MKDLFEREINYLRLSVTDKCNLRCLYCMPEDGVQLVEHKDILTNEEIVLICKVAIDLGITKIRVTGGEPLVRKNIIELLRNIRKINGLKELCITTNGAMLKQYAKDLKEAGVDRINISLDTLNEAKYKYITRIGNIENALDGIKETLKYNFNKIKINTVLIGGFNDDEIVDLVNLTKDYDIDVRFIELMPMTKNSIFGDEAYISGDEVLKKIENYEKVEIDNRGVARLYKMPNAKGKFGIITPLSNHFCNDCSRLRVTFDGKIKPCLHSKDEINIKGLNENEIKEKFIEAISKKPQMHVELSSNMKSEANRNMNAIGG